MKRRETDFYQYCVLAGNDVLNHMLNPVTGQLTVDKVAPPLSHAKQVAISANQKRMEEKFIIADFAFIWDNAVCKAFRWVEASWMATFQRRKGGVFEQ